MNYGDPNETIIDIGECANIIKEYYNISENKTLYIKKLDIIQDDINIPKIEYDIYAKLDNIKLYKLYR